MGERRPWCSTPLLAEELIFGLGDLVADLSRLITLEPGDVVLTGTPTGSTVVQPGDVVEVEVTAGDRSSGRLRTPIEDDARRPGAVGGDARARPTRTSATRTAPAP